MHTYEIIHRNLCHLCDIPKSEWNKFEHLFNVKTLSKGELLLSQGELSKNFYYITKGIIRYFYTSENGKEFNKSFHLENEFAGSLLSTKMGLPSTFNIQALEDCQLITIAYSELAKLYDSHPCWEKIGRVMAEDLAMEKERREREFLLDDAQTRYKTFIKNHPKLVDRISLGHIASYLGITQVQLSRIRKNIS